MIDIMTKSKTSTLALLITIISFMSGSCSNEETSLSAPQPLVLQGQVYTFDSEDGTIWNGAQEIGVFFIDADKKTLIDEYVNLKYFADNRNTTGYFVPEGEPIYLKDSQMVNAIAYYPYKETDELTGYSATQYLYQLDLSNQKNLKPDVFLYAYNATELSNTNYKATLELRPILSMVKLTFIESAGMSEERLKNMSLKLKGMPLKADFDILTGEFVSNLQQRGMASKATTDLLDGDNNSDSQDENDDEGNNDIDIDVNDNLTVNIILFPSELSQNATLELALPADDNSEAITMSWSLNSVISEMKENTEYTVIAKVSEEGITGELTGESLIYIQDWNKDEEVNGSANPEIPEPAILVTDGDFESLTNISVSASVPASANVWYGLKNNDNFQAGIYNDSEQGNVAHMKCSNDLLWYKNYIGYTATGAKAKSYRLKFKASTIGGAAQANLQVYTRINKAGNYFFVLKDVDLTKACAARVVTVGKEWTEYTIDFDFTQQVNTIWGSGITVSSTSEEDFMSFYIAFVAQNADVDYYLDDITLEEIN